MSGYPPVPYISQINGVPRRNDCGPACALTLIESRSR